MPDCGIPLSIGAAFACFDGGGSTVQPAVGSAGGASTVQPAVESGIYCRTKVPFTFIHATPDGDLAMCPFGV